MPMPTETHNRIASLAALLVLAPLTSSGPLSHIRAFAPYSITTIQLTRQP